MLNKALILIGGLLISSAAMAQDYGLTIGLHQTTASVDTTTAGSQLAGFQGSTSGSLGFDAGLTASFELVPMVRFRTGLLYDQRPFIYTMSNSNKVTFNFAYLDVPIDVQYNITPMFALYGGLIAGIKASDSVSLPASAPSTLPGPGMKSLYPFLNVGANFTFNDLLGFDVYYESGLGSFSDNGKNYSTFGMHFIYWL